MTIELRYNNGLHEIYEDGVLVPNAQVIEWSQEAIPVDTSKDRKWIAGRVTVRIEMPDGREIVI